LKTAGGDVKFGAGNKVLLVPVTPYTTARTKLFLRAVDSKLANLLTPEADPRLQKYIRSVIADASGTFEFQNIPSGDYYVLCPIFWSVPNFTLSTIDETGGVAFAKVTVSDGETVKVVVTR